MLKFALFAGENYYPGGGWEDFRGTYATLEEATAAGKMYLDDSYGRWYHVVDLSAGAIVDEG